MPGRLQSIWGSEAARLFALALGAFGLAVASLAFTRGQDHVAAIWPANALALAVMLRSPPRSWAAYAATAAAGIMVANLAVGDPAGRALLLAACNGGEILIAAALASRLTAPDVDVTEPRQLLSLCCVAAAAPVAPALMATAVLGDATAGTLIRWYLADALGLAVVTPAVLALVADAGSLKATFRRKGKIAPLIALVAAWAVAFGQETYPLHFLLFPPLVWCAMTLRSAGNALVLLLTAVVAVTATLTGHGTAGLIDDDMQTKLAVLQGLLATMTFSTLPLTALLARQRRLNASLRDALAQVGKSEERYRNLFTSIDEGFCIIEVLFNEHQKPLDYRFLEINPSFEAQSGLRDATGKRMRELSPVHEEYWFEIYGKVALTGDPIRLVKEAKSLGRWFDVYAFSVDDPALHQVAVLFHDITERRRFEGELTTARTTAEAANVAKSVFLSNMSHELRTPLSAILGFAQLLDSGAPAPTPPQKKSLDQILRAGWHLLDLINEILDLALIESGKLSMSIESVSLHEVLLECQAMIESQAQGRGVEMRFPSLAKRHFVETDRLRLKQILLNLLSNAIKYNKANGEVTVACAKPSPDRLRISVADTGEGLTPEQVAKLFEPFNRLGQERGTKEGTGIGLVVCKQLVELMGGVIGVESTVGVGSTFWFELNLTPETLDPSGIPGALAQSKPHSLLYIEDDPTNLSLVEVLLRHHPTIRLLSAVDGWSGVTLARSSQPDVILMDINLPGMSGLEALKILQSDPLTAHIPILAISANAMLGDIKRGLDAGFHRYLTKPIKVAEFTEALGGALKFAETKSTQSKKDHAHHDNFS